MDHVYWSSGTAECCPEAKTRNTVHAAALNRRKRNANLKRSPFHAQSGICTPVPNGALPSRMRKRAKKSSLCAPGVTLCLSMSMLANVCERANAQACMCVKSHISQIACKRTRAIVWRVRARACARARRRMFSTG
eukprot:528710-Pleurochrysis_carterae.AAC.4